MDVVLDTPPVFQGFDVAGTGRGAASPAPVPPGVQRALHVGDLPFRVLPSGPFDRLYAGWEFCAARIGTSQRARDVVRAAAGQGVPVTLVTPPTRNPHLPLVMAAIETFAAVVPEGEVVVNDWGVLHEVRRAFPGLARVLGRLLFRMHRDPASPLLAGAAAGRRAGGLTQLGSPAFQWVLQEYAIRRVEADAVLPEFPFPEGCAGLPAMSLHVPFRYLTQTFSCRAAGLNRPGTALPIDHCQRECDGRMARVDRRGGKLRELHVGNAVFLRDDGFPSIAPGSPIDRLVLRRLPLL